MRTEGKGRLGEVLFAGFLVAVGAGAVLYTGSWPLKAALYPRVVGSALVLASLACCLLAALDRGKSGPRLWSWSWTLTYRLPWCGPGPWSPWAGWGASWWRAGWWG
jgi:hypothetical protein